MRSAPRVRTGIVMLNLGGPSTQAAVHPFLLRLFSDREIIKLPMQSVAAPLIAKLRAPRVRKLYESIGGGSPLGHWTKLQGEGMVRHLDRISPETGPHKFYAAFRYAEPFADEALDTMVKDGVERAVAFSQYPQWSCTTTGSSLNDLWKHLKQKHLVGKIQWSVIDRWYNNDSFLTATAERIKAGLEKVPANIRDKTPVLFSAHSLPMSVAERGDSYPGEVAATAHALMQRLSIPNPYIVCYQSAVGPAAWLGPRTERTIQGYAKRKIPAVFVVPVAFTSDHVETLRELDIDYKKVADDAGIGFYRMESLNDSPRWLQAMADIVHEHLKKDSPHSPQYTLRCPSCTNENCRPPITGATPI